MTVRFGLTVIAAALLAGPAAAQSPECKNAIGESARLSKLIFETAEKVKTCVNGADKAPCVAELDRIKSMADTIVSQTAIQTKSCAPATTPTKRVPPEVTPRNQPRTTPQTPPRTSP